MKTCIKCCKMKDLSLFNKNKCTKDGHGGVCKECNKVLEIHKNLLTTQLNHETIELERKQSEQE